VLWCGSVESACPPQAQKLAVSLTRQTENTNKRLL